jgi:hypothetical protein
MRRRERVGRLDRGKAAFLTEYRALCVKYGCFVVIAEDETGYSRFVLASMEPKDEDARAAFDLGVLEMLLEDVILVERT